MIVMQKRIILISLVFVSFIFFSVQILADGNNVTCTNTNGGLDYYRAGTTVGIYNGQYSQIHDYCTTGSDIANVMKFYCTNSTTVVSQPYYCPNGCKLGACIDTNETPVTVNEQSVCNFYNGSSCNLYLNHAVGFEISGDSYLLSVESISNNSALINVSNQQNPSQNVLFNLGVNSNFPFNNIIITLESVSSDYVLVGISTINSAPSCTDSDRGINYYIKGAVTDTAHDTSYTDTCTNLQTTDASGGWMPTLNGSILAEYYCGQSSYQYVFYQCPNGCYDGACIGSNDDFSEGGENSSTSSTVNTCNGCFLDAACVPVGYRTAGSYCDIGYNLIQFKSTNAQCNNNFECSSNFCISNQCVSPTLIQRIINWFRRLFGAG